MGHARDPNEFLEVFGNELRPVVGDDPGPRFRVKFLGDVRQLRDIKIKLAVETFEAARMIVFAKCCGYSLALSHARSGDPAVISGYIGKSDTFDQAIAAFSFLYADQNEKDHAVLKRAIRDAKIKAEVEQAKRAQA